MLNKVLIAQHKLAKFSRLQCILKCIWCCY